MTNSGDYTCELASPAYTGEAAAHIGEEGLEFSAVNRTFSLDYSKVLDFRLINYRLFLDTPEGKYALFKLGWDTEAFFENFWLAYDGRSREALFVEGAPERESEGEYAYSDGGGSAKSKAKVGLWPDCVCILPHSSGARRVPLCFVQEMTIDNYTVHIALDTGEHYDIMRLGRDTQPFYEALCQYRDTVQAAWQAAHAALERNLDARLGGALERYRLMRDAGQNMITGLFSPDGEEFWAAAFGDGTAAVELVTEEKTATYLYRFAEDKTVFERRLRHAMESVRLHREIIYIQDAELEANPFYVMAAARNAHLRFLRSRAAGRVIHTESWGQRVSDFLRGREGQIIISEQF